MVIADAIMFGVVGSLAGYIAYINREIIASNRRMSESYFNHVEEQTKLLTSLKGSFELHDTLSAETHEKQCTALDEMTTQLKSLNGKEVTVSSNK